MCFSDTKVTSNPLHLILGKCMVSKKLMGKKSKGCKRWVPIGSGGAHPLGRISCSYMHFSGENGQIIAFHTDLSSLRSHSNPGSATGAGSGSGLQPRCKGAMGVQPFHWATMGILKFRVHFLVFILFGWSKVIRSLISCPWLPLALECTDHGYTAYFNGEQRNSQRESNRF